MVCWSICLLLALLVCTPVTSFIINSLSPSLIYRNYVQKTNLEAHHPQKKIIKKIMDRRPRKHRPSDINRRNVNLNKCITKVPNSLPEYTIIPADDIGPYLEACNQFWAHGDPSTPFLQIVEDDQAVNLPRNRELPPPGSFQKKPKLLRAYPR